MKGTLSTSVLALGALMGCTKTGAAPSPPQGVTPQPIAVTSTSFAPNAPIPPQYTCDGKDVVPELAWSGAPESARALVLVVDDPDAPGGVFTHLLAWNVRPDARELVEGAAPQSLGATLGKNDFGKLGWSGPCPPKGSLHHYRFRVLASDAPVGLAEGASRSALDAALAGHVVGDGTLVGTFQH